MMDEKTDASTDRSGQSTDLSAVYAIELDAAGECLNAEHGDLGQLLIYIHANHVPRRRVSDMLKSAFSNLARLRESHAALSSLDGLEPEFYTLCQQLGRALKGGQTFSLKAAMQALEDARILCSEDDCKPEIVAQIIGTQAIVAAIRQEFSRVAELYETAATVKGLDVPAQWKYQNERALALVDLGRDYTDNAALQRAAELYETKIVDLAPQDLRPADWVETQCNLADTLGILGHRHRGTHILERSVEIYERALSQLDRNEFPQIWATIQNNLGNALGALGQRQGSTELLEKSVTAFELALEERSQDNTPDDWATTQNNLGAALHSIGQRGEGTKLLSKSVKAYTKVLKIWTRQRMPLEWATALNNLGTVLRVLGERQSATRTLEKSVAAYQNALTFRSREQFPQDWAMTQNNLGAALQKLAERVEGTQELEDAVTAYNNALKVWTKEKMPMGWTMTMANLGVARRTLAERAGDLEIAQMAVADISIVAEFFRDASHAQYRELSEEQLTKAREVVEKLENS